VRQHARWASSAARDSVHCEMKTGQNVHERTAALVEKFVSRSYLGLTGP
jgi:hypothetical protein